MPVAAHQDELVHRKALSYRRVLDRHQPAGAMLDGRDRGPLDSAVTDSTAIGSSSPGGGSPSPGTTGEGRKKKKKRRGLRRRLGLRLPSLFKRRRRRPPSEAKLRKKLRKAAEKGNWDAVRKLIDGYEFPGRPEAEGASTTKAKAKAKKGRRPTGESAAAAAAIRDNGSGSMRGDVSRPWPSSAPGHGERPQPQLGENILHDVCRHRPPLDVLETLLAALRHHRGHATAALDDRGRTPLHLAAAAGAGPSVVDALVRADPAPASVGDEDGRSPLHLFVQRLVDHPPVRAPGSFGDGNGMEKIIQVVRVLKDAMLAYPGRVDFKDEDHDEYSPLDYALRANIQDKELLQALMRRKEPRYRRSSFTRRRGEPRPNNLTSGRSVYSGSGASKSTEDLQDLQLLLKLEEDEIKARRDRLKEMEEREREDERRASMNDALFDVFGIEEAPIPRAINVGAIVFNEQEANGQEDAGQRRKDDMEDEMNDAMMDMFGVEGLEGWSAAHTPSVPHHGSRPPPEEFPPLPSKKGPTVAETTRPSVSTKTPSLHHKHMGEFLDEYGQITDLERDGEDGYDIFLDPDEHMIRQMMPQVREVIEGPPVKEITFDEGEGDDCASLVSEVTVPLVPWSRAA